MSRVKNEVMNDNGSCKCVSLAINRKEREAALTKTIVVRVKIRTVRVRLSILWF